MFFVFAGKTNSIEERVSLLELQVADLHEYVDFLLGGTVIQDERLLKLEETMEEINVDCLGKQLLHLLFTHFISKMYS